MLDELVLNEYHTRVKNPMYWDADNVILEKVTGLVINDVEPGADPLFCGRA